MHVSAVRSTKEEFDQNPALQAAWDTLIAGVTGCAYSREGYGSVTPMLVPGSTGLRRSALFCARKLLSRALRRCRGYIQEDVTRRQLFLMHCVMFHAMVCVIDLVDGSHIDRVDAFMANASHPGPVCVFHVAYDI